MGGGSWSSTVYHDRATVRSVTGDPVFAHTADINSGKTARAVHDKMNPLGVKMRESRDSDTHPETLGIAVFFDVTGSMGQIPIELQKRLATLMAMIIQKGFVAHPQILFGAVGDANSDQAPLQIGQFESDITMEDDLSRIWLEGNGGGQQRETYELAYYWAARHTSIDCFEKRGKKGYLFTIGDEDFYPMIHRTQVKDLIGDDLQADVTTAAIVRELEQKYHVFHIIAEQGSYKDNAEIERSWKGLLGERVLKLYDVNGVAELIATTIGLTEGTTDLDAASDAMRDLGVDHALIGSVSQALATYATSTAALVKTGSATGIDSSAPSVERL